MMRKIFLFGLFILLLVGCRDRKTNPQTSTPIGTIEVKKPQVKVYIENSGSMDGFVKGRTEFESAVYNYLSDISISDITDNLSLFYINSEIIPWDEQADADVISDFIEKLEPQEFKNRGGNRGASDIANILKLILHETKDDEVSILVTDGIFSPGRGKDADEYLVNQEIGIKTALARYLKDHNGTAVMVYQLMSNFTGNYYDREDHPIAVSNVKLPFYIWIIGKADYLSRMRNKIPESNFGGSGVKKMFSMVKGDQPINYAIKFKSGSFKVSRNNPNEIIDLKADRDGKVRFSVNVNFDNLLQDEAYLLDTSNYELKNYDITIRPAEDRSRFTHTIAFTADKRKKKNGELCVKLKIQEPDWSDVNNEAGTSVVEEKTYGIKYQISGVYKAFMSANEESKDYAKICINIK